MVDPEPDEDIKQEKDKHEGEGAQVGGDQVVERLARPGVSLPTTPQ